MMITHDGNISDLTNYRSENFIEINSCGYQKTTENYTVIRENGRLDYHILLIESGQCHASYLDRRYTLNAGNLIIYFPNQYQKYTFNPDTLSMWIHFSGKCADEILASFSIESGAYFFRFPPDVTESFSKLIRRFNQQDTKPFANASLMELLASISMCVNKTARESNMAITNIISFINKNYNKHFSIPYLADKAGYSVSRFTHLFSKIVGTSPIKYQNDIRLNTAYEILSSTSMNVSEVSDMCGFADPLYFSRLFKKKYGISPAELRYKKEKWKLYN